jgi:aspartyl/asparaginyl beta-hydroxylase (cupin superfamily)
VFYEPELFDFSAVLEQNWLRIHDEFLAIKSDLMDWYEKELYGQGWKVFGLFNFPRGEAIEPNVRRCPLTAALIQRHVPRHGAAGFSVLAPATRIQSHQGYQGDFLRCHLGLEVPAGECALQVGAETRSWQAGKVLIFDDRVTHGAWNLTERARVILLIDFIPP